MSLTETTTPVAALGVANSFTPFALPPVLIAAAAGYVRHWMVWPAGDAR